jgi:hypothetical protein
LLAIIGARSDDSPRRKDDMRGLKHLIPDDVRNRLNEWPIFQLAVIALIAAVGTFLVWNGLKGIRTKAITSKGRKYTGGTAIAVGVLR